MIQPLPIRVCEPSLESFEWVGFGKLTIPARPVQFGFQLDMVPTFNHPEISFGIVQRDPSNHSLKMGFAVRIDFERGEIWDLCNNMGLVGWLEQPYGNQGYSPEEPMLLSWEVERIGSALIPRLQVGGEEWLYPSIRSTEDLELSAIAGCASDLIKPQDSFIHPALWLQEKP